MIGGGELWKLLEFLAREKQKPQRPSSAATFELTAKLPAGMHHLLLETTPASQDAQGEGENRVIDIGELRRVLAEAKHSRAEMNKIGYADVTRAEVDLLHAAVNALPELLDEIERLRDYETAAGATLNTCAERIAELERQNTDLQRRNTELVERNRQLEAAVTRLAALARCDCLTLPVWVRNHQPGCSFRRAVNIIKALKEKAE